jgi:hypothetical protein
MLKKHMRSVSLKIIPQELSSGGASSPVVGPLTAPATALASMIMSPNSPAPSETSLSSLEERLVGLGNVFQPTTPLSSPFQNQQGGQVQPQQQELSSPVLFSSFEDLFLS